MYRALFVSFLALAGCTSGSGVCTGGVDDTPADICDADTTVIGCAASYEQAITYACHSVDAPTFNGDYGACGDFLVAHGGSLLEDWWCFYDAATGALAGSISCGDSPNACGSMCARRGDVGLCCAKLPTACSASN
jgi:hypothetical protein